jgi:choline dehydrogenase-like flavoprotein
MFDYVVVGAGSAGCVLAARLGEDRGVRVGVIEAGPPDSEPVIHMPLAFRQLWESRFDWGLWSESEPGLGDRRDLLPRGRVLGGSSSLNVMIYMRGNRADYDGWAAAGFDGWGYEDVLPYFRRAEDNERGESYYHGVGGPLTVSDCRSMHPLVGACIEAAVDAGIAPNDDHNGPRQEGAGWFQFTQRDGRRCSTAVAYLRPAVAGGNVEVLTDALATRIVFEGERAVAVEVLRDNALETVRAEREVIVCAGAYHSPQLLLLSGIGPADELRPLGIEPRVDLPVGKNLHDHPAVVLVWLTDQESLRTAMTPENRALFPHDGFSILPTLLAPTSRGRVTLRSALAHAKPRILHNYYATEEDTRTVIDGTRVALEIASRPALRTLRTADWAVPESESDADLLDFVRRNTRTLFHPGGTCAMGAVVDSELRVHGLERLRVVDASVMPAVPRGNTNAPVIMIAEKAADLIRGLPPLPRQHATRDPAGLAAEA